MPNVLLKSELEGGQSKDYDGNMMRFKSPRRPPRGRDEAFLSLSPIGEGATTGGVRSGESGHE